MWNCCASGTAPYIGWSCESPSDQIFLDTPPQSLSTLARLPSSTAPPVVLQTTYTPPANVLASATATAAPQDTNVHASAMSSTSTPSSSSGGGLSTGAKAGIGIGAAFGAILLFALLGPFILRQWRIAARENSPEKLDSNSHASSGHPPHIYAYEKSNAATGAAAGAGAPLNGSPTGSYRGGGSYHEGRQYGDDTAHQGGRSYQDGRSYGGLSRSGTAGNEDWRSKPLPAVHQLPAGRSPEIQELPQGREVSELPSAEVASVNGSMRGKRKPGDTWY